MYVYLFCLAVGHYLCSKGYWAAGLKDISFSHSFIHPLTLSFHVILLLIYNKTTKMAMTTYVQQQQKQQQLEQKFKQQIQKVPKNNNNKSPLRKE